MSNFLHRVHTSSYLEYFEMLFSYDFVMVFEEYFEMKSYKNIQKVLQAFG